MTVVYKSYTQIELNEAFTAVQNRDNWKMPIQAKISAEKVDVTIAAIEFYAGGNVDTAEIVGAMVLS